MERIRTCLLFDLVIQSVLISFVSIPLLLAPYEPPLVIWSLIGLLPLGLWQIVSAFILGFALPDKIRRLYLLTAVAFCGLFFSAGFFIEQLNWRTYPESLLSENIPIYVFLAIMGLSYVAAWYYFLYSYRSFRMGKKDIAL